MKRVFCSSILIVSGFLPLTPNFAQSPILPDPVFIRVDKGWQGLFAHGGEYAEYSFKGQGIKLQDPYHALLAPGVGVMVTFADMKEFGDKPDLLTAHRQWELGYWSKHAARMESKARDDLSGARIDLKVTEIKLYNNEGSQLTVYCLALASKEGVFVLSVSGPNESIPGNIDLMVKEIADSFRLVRRPLDAAEVKRISMEIKAAQ